MTEIVPDIDISVLRFVLEEKAISRRGLFLPKIVAFPDRYWVNKRMLRCALIRLDFLLQEYVYVKDSKTGVEGLVLQYILTKEIIMRNWNVTNTEHFNRASPGYNMSVLKKNIIVTMLYKNGMNLQDSVGTILIPFNILPNKIDEAMPTLTYEFSLRIIKNFDEVIRDGNEFIL